MEYNYDQNSELLMCRFEGHLDAVTTKDADNLVQKAIKAVCVANPAPLENSKVKCVFDMKSVDFVSSSFLRICIATSKKFASGNFLISNTSPTIKRTFKLAGLDGILKIS